MEHVRHATEDCVIVNQTASESQYAQEKNLDRARRNRRRKRPLPGSQELEDYKGEWKQFLRANYVHVEGLRVANPATMAKKWTRDLGYRFNDGEASEVLRPFTERHGYAATRGSDGRFTGKRTEAARKPASSSAPKNVLVRTEERDTARTEAAPARVIRYPVISSKPQLLDQKITSSDPDASRGGQTEKAKKKGRPLSDLDLLTFAIRDEAYKAVQEHFGRERMALAPADWKNRNVQCARSLAKQGHSAEIVVRLLQTAWIQDQPYLNEIDSLSRLCGAWVKLQNIANPPRRNLYDNGGRTNYAPPVEDEIMPWDTPEQAEEIRAAARQRAEEAKASRRGRPRPGSALFPPGASEDGSGVAEHGGSAFQAVSAILGGVNSRSRIASPRRNLYDNGGRTNYAPPEAHDIMPWDKPEDIEHVLASPNFTDEQRARLRKEHGLPPETASLGEAA